MENNDSIRQLLLELTRMSRPELCERWKALYGREPPNSSREFLRRRLAYRVQEIAYGGLEIALKRELTPEVVPDRKRASILHDGTRILRSWKGKECVVTVRGDKYEYEGKLYRSLSGIAKTITGTNWNGNEFFGITKR